MKNVFLIDSFGVTERNGIAVVSSRYVADIFEKRHDNVLRDIEEIKNNLLNFEESNLDQYFIPGFYKNLQNKRQPEYLLTRNGFTLLAMGYSGKKAMQFKITYINRFNQMEEFIRNLMEAKADFPEFTDAVMAAHEEPKHYHFSNELDMINRIVTGMSARQYREQNGIKAGKSIRPYLSSAQLYAVKALQRIDIGLLISIPDFQQRKELLEQQYKRLTCRVLTA